jgi:putative Mg2+ transporter-C (MgtC) family protein
MVGELEIVIRMATSVVAGALLGWEREAHNKPAGLKTHMLVALGSAAFMLAGVLLHNDLVAHNQAGGADLLKVLAGIVGGIGFLGAGAIFRSSGEIRGLTTAATIWMASAVGIACGLGQYVLATAAVGLALAVLLLMRLAEQVFFPDRPAGDAAVETDTARESST